MSTCGQKVTKLTFVDQKFKYICNDIYLAFHI